MVHLHSKRDDAGKTFNWGPIPGRGPRLVPLMQVLLECIQSMKYTKYSTEDTDFQLCCDIIYEKSTCVLRDRGPSTLKM